MYSSTEFSLLHAMCKAVLFKVSLVETVRITLCVSFSCKLDGFSKFDLECGVKVSQLVCASILQCHKSFLEYAYPVTAFEGHFRNCIKRTLLPKVHYSEVLLIKSHNSSLSQRREEHLQID